MYYAHIFVHFQVNNMCDDNMNCNVDDLHTTCEEENGKNKMPFFMPDKNDISLSYSLDLCVV